MDIDLNRYAMKRYGNGEYVGWLIDRVDASDYDQLAIALFNIDYYWDIPMDQNRADDGIYLRQVYADEMGKPIDAVLDPLVSTVLEMLVAFAERTNFITSERYSTSHWFKMFISNLDIDWYDYAYVDVNGIDNDDIIKKVNHFMHHKYNYDGSNGGLFVVNDPPHDLRDTELWYQMQYWNQQFDIPEI